MCGIAGRLNLRSGAPVEPASLERMCDLIAHRGPDAWGTYCDGPVGLAHRRLAIIDLSPAGKQPMWTADGAVGITFNGEIYNFQELRAELEGHGHVFRSRSDTEVILAAYRQWGVECVPRLAGMFALALWDAPERRLVLARDRLGKKPLFYRIDDDGIAFASEPKAFLAETSFRPEPDLQALSQYLSYQYVPAPRSAFKGVSKLPPAHTLVFERGRSTVAPYWKLAYEPKQATSEAEALDGLDEHLRRAVKRRLMSDVPLGAFLSGGIDSGLTVSYMAECLDQPVRSFSIGFAEEAYDELPAARLVAQKFATQHTEFVVRPQAIDLLPQLVWHYGEPYADSSALPTYVLSALTRRHVTVALNGDGGDENFAGYDRYIAALDFERLDRIPSPLRSAVAAVAKAAAGTVDHPQFRRVQRLASRLTVSQARRHATWVMQFTPEAKAGLCLPEFQDAAPDDSYALLEAVFASSDAGNAVDQALDADVQTYLPDDLLVKVDIATMAHGLEGRSPFLDHELMAFAATLPPDLKVRSREKKYLLRRLAARRLPPHLLTLPKKGFSVPIDHWFRGELLPFTRDVLLDGRLAARGYFDMKAVRRLVDEHAAGTTAWHSQLWNLLMLELWHRMFIDQRPAGAPAAVTIDADLAPSGAAR